MVTGILFTTFLIVLLVLVLVFGIVGLALRLVFKVTSFSLKVLLMPIVLAALAVAGVLVLIF